jgi:signal transduction histidine kinase
MRTEIVYETVPEAVQAVFFPKFSDDLTVAVNGVMLHQPLYERRLWNDPLLVPLPTALLRPGANRLDLTLSGPLPGHLDLRAFHVGDHKTLSAAYRARNTLGPGMTRFVLGLMIMFTIGYTLFWLRRRSDHAYLWLGLSCLSAAAFLLPLGYSFPMGGYREWRLVQTGGMSAYVYFMLKFVRLYLDTPKSWIERSHAVLLSAGLIVMALCPIEYVYTVSLVLSLGATLSAIYVVVLFWQYRTRVEFGDFLAFFVSCSLAMTFALDGLLLWLSDMPPRSLHLLHLMPLFTSIVCFWLILTQLVQSLSRQQMLTDTLQDAIAEKSRQLEESFAKLAQAERERAVNEERGRIMLDLHDGIGGQLVSTLAYMENANAGDETVRRALEDALRDLAVMLDSIESQDNLSTLLGMMRTRLEGLLADHGAAFVWKIEDEPTMSHKGPSANLHVARIVQEAITNVIKHAKARTVTIHTDRSRIVVSDDGIGFDVTLIGQQGTRGHGLLGMKRRAKAINAALSIESTAEGTRVILKLDSPPVLDTAAATPAQEQDLPRPPA